MDTLLLLSPSLPTSRFSLILSLLFPSFNYFEALPSEEYGAKELKGLEDFENPLDPVNHLHYLIKRFLYAHSGFERSEILGYLNLYAFVLNPPADKLEKVDILLNLVFQNPKLLRFRDRHTANRDFPS